ncbi:glycosyltransferase family 39 protein [Roseovarius litorisediminis]|nr:glycosyltransferase family 39 protein [Roseovarius litorisediminis]
MRTFDGRLVRWGKRAELVELQMVDSSLDFRKQQHALLAILGLGLILRLVWAALIPIDPLSDSVAYQTFAENIINHGVYGWEPDKPGAYWAVGTSALLAAGYHVFGMHSWVVIGLNLSASLLSIIILFNLGNRYFGRPSGMFAALLFALWPLTIQYTTIIASELFFICFVLIGLYFWERAKSTTYTVLWLLAAGAAFAGASYIRPIALLLPIFLTLFEVLRGETRILNSLLRMLLVLVTIGVLIAPWSYRNYQVFGKPVMISTNFGANFWMGNNPNTSGGYQPLPDRLDGLSETEKSDILLGEAKEFISENPTAFLKRTALKAVQMHNRETIGAHWNKTQILSKWGETGFKISKIVPTVYWYAMLALALAGLVAFVRANGFWAMLLCTPVMIWGYVTSLHSIIVVSDRYHSPSIPFICLIASYALATLYNSRRRTG